MDLKLIEGKDINDMFFLSMYPSIPQLAILFI